ncbi:MAG: hypothetical protein R2710_25970 [Acidimicrobiales bacterium]
MRKASMLSPNSTARTVRDLLERCLWTEPGRLEASTVDEYRRMSRTRILPTMGHIHLHKLDADTLEQFYDEMLEEGLSPRSCQKAHTILQGAFKRAIRWGWVDSSPMVGVKVPRGPAYRIQPPTPETVRRLFDFADEDEQFGMGVAVRTAALAGLRRGEMLGLQVQDIKSVELVVERAIAEIRDGGTVVKARSRIRLVSYRSPISLRRSSASGRPSTGQSGEGGQHGACVAVLAERRSRSPVDAVCVVVTVAEGADAGRGGRCPVP